MSLRERTYSIAPPGTPSPDTHKDKVVTLQLRDIIDRLPAALLAQGDHDLNRAITFEIAELARRIAEGNPMLNLAEVQRQAPELFAQEAKNCDGIHVRFPWRALVDMLCAADSSNPLPGLTRAGALTLAGLLRIHRGPRPLQAPQRFQPSQAALSRAPQWFVRPQERTAGPPTGYAHETGRALHELALALEHLANPAPPLAAPPESPDNADLQNQIAIVTEENTRLRQEISVRNEEVDKLKAALQDLENAAIEQIAVLNQHCEEIAAKTTAPASQPEQTETPLNPQQTATIASLSQQITELYAELDRAKEESLSSASTFVRLREQKEASDEAVKSLEQYLASVAYELERANAMLKESEIKLHHTEAASMAKAAEIHRLIDELLQVRSERDALREKVGV